MAYLSLSDDELALLRFTCDLFFVEESPLYYLECEAREPVDYESVYHSLLEKNVVDPHGFRITDDALNRLAPVTECDARLACVVQSPGAAPEQTDFWLLDEIAVELVRGAGGVALGHDLDPDELTEHLARRLVPRKPGGDRLALALTPVELCALSVLAGAAAESVLALDVAEARRHLGAARLVQARRAAPAAPPPRTQVHVRVGIPTPQDEVDEDEELTLTRTDPGASLDGLLAKGALRLEDGRLRLRPALAALLDGMRSSVRHTFVRSDFGDEAWLLRETTFFASQGTLVSLRIDGDSLCHLEELDGSTLREALNRAVGPLPRDQRAPAPRPLRELLLGFEREVTGAGR